MSNDNSITSDGMLIEAVLSGRTERFAEIVRRYESPLLRVARSRLGRIDWAEDVVQETFLCTFRSLHSYDSRYSFRTWLWTILLNQCRRVYQKHTRQPQVRAWSDQPPGGDGRPRDAGEPQCHRELPPARLLAKERAEMLEKLLATLPEAQADALRLRFYGGLTFQEIADAMGCSLSSAKNRVRWGLSKMSQIIHPDEALNSVDRRTAGESNGEA